jgi:hypothetical protein
MFLSLVSPEDGPVITIEHVVGNKTSNLNSCVDVIISISN